MVGELRDHDVGQQPRGRDAFVDDLRRNRCLDQGFALIADPLATDVPLNGEHARRVVEFLADILADTLESAAALAMAVVGFVVDQSARKLRRQGGAFRFLPNLGRSGSKFQRFKFGFDGRNIGVDQVIKQTGLIRAQLLAALGKLEALELRNLVGQLFDNRLVAVDLLTHCLDFLIETLDTLHQLRRQSTQLFRV
ncbi:hypothetical protein D3C81_1072090 [compost metagenome]